MTILAILQNQWFKNPAVVKEVFDRNQEKRNELIKRLLFSGCVTGRRLRDAFGIELCNKIIWEEASPLMANHSGGAFKADLAHINTSIAQHKPEIIICFGKIAGDAVKSSLSAMRTVFYAPHPAARGNTMAELLKVAQQVKSLLAG